MNCTRKMVQKPFKIDKDGYQTDQYINYCNDQWNVKILYWKIDFFCNADIVIEKPAPNKPLEEYIHYET